MKSTINQSPDGSKPKTLSARVNPIPKTNAVGAPTQHPQNPRETSGT